ncbi:MAG TPA: AAA family ATPase [Actinomycetota bacterium]|nr:AAA family ATPase [Actinomycetota bacterium]
MIVEFVGGSGAGKSTLLEAVRQRATGRVITSAELVMDRPGRRWVTNPKAVNLVADVTVLPSFLLGPARDRAFVRFAFDRLRRSAPSRFAKVNYLREVVRDVGKHELAARAAADTIVLVDEGAVLTASHLFVYSTGGLERSELERFADLVPLPDRIVYVTAPVPVLVERSMRRPDRRRELARADRAEVERWSARASEVFDRLVAAPRFRDRTLIVDTRDDSPAARREAADAVVAFLDGRTPVGGSAEPTVRAGEAEGER